MRRMRVGVRGANLLFQVLSILGHRGLGWLQAYCSAGVLYGRAGNDSLYLICECVSINLRIIALSGFMTVYC